MKELVKHSMRERLIALEALVEVKEKRLALAQAETHSALMERDALARLLLRFKGKRECGLCLDPTDPRPLCILCEVDLALAPVTGLTPTTQKEAELELQLAHARARIRALERGMKHLRAEMSRSAG